MRNKIQHGGFPDIHVVQNPSKYHVFPKVEYKYSCILSAKSLTDVIYLFYLVRCLPVLAQGLKTSPSGFGLDEFFPPGVLDKGELAPEVVKTGKKEKKC